MSDVVVQWKCVKSGQWQDFPAGDLVVLSVQRVCDLFSNCCDVVAKVNGEYLVNSKRLMAQYRKKGARVQLFDDLSEAIRNQSWRSFIEGMVA